MGEALSDPQLQSDGALELDVGGSGADARRVGGARGRRAAAARAPLRAVPAKPKHYININTIIFTLRRERNAIILVLAPVGARLDVSD